uniref:Myosin motor domain-containing protein n=1 Tax=Angiostrongylus cantonensis TaxID=6313 RepID=A0A0K0DQB1_ANGCA
MDARYPERVPFRDFRRRFGCLVEDELNSSINNALDDRAAVSWILERMDIHPSRYRLGISQVLLASDVMNELEDRREFSLSGLVTAFQRECRKYLASKWLHHRRILETAIKCLQVCLPREMKHINLNFLAVFEVKICCGKVVGI